MVRLGPDNFSTLQMKGHVLHRARAHLKVPGCSLVKKALLTNVKLTAVTFLAHSSDSNPHNLTELRQEIVSYLFPFPPISKNLAFRLAILIFAKTMFCSHIKFIGQKFTNLTTQADLLSLRVVALPNSFLAI